MATPDLPAAPRPIAEIAPGGSTIQNKLQCAGAACVTGKPQCPPVIR